MVSRILAAFKTAVTLIECFAFAAIFLPLTILALPALADAAQLGPGCHVATAAEQQEMIDRGIPASFEVCPADQVILGLGKDFDQWYAQLKAMPPCNKSICTLSCRTRNTGAQVCGPTATRWNSIGCHPNNNTAIFPSVAYGFAAHIELLRRYCGERGRCTIGTVTQQWATGTNGSTQSPYAAFVSKAAGVPSNQVFDPNDIDVMARIALAMSCYEAGSLPYELSDLKQGLSMAAGGPRVPTPANVGALLQESLMGSYAPNPSYSPNSHPGSWTYPQATTFGGNYVPPPAASLAAAIKAPIAALPNPQLASQLPSATSTNPGSTSVTTILAPQTPVGLIIVQPSTVSRGIPLVVSWSTLGMSTQTPCTVTQNSTQLSQGNAGSNIVQTRALGSGPVSFALSCTTAGGQIFTQAASATVR